MKTELMQKLSRTVHKTGFKIKQHSPEILVAVGIVGTVTSVVLACKATLKVNDVVEEAQETIEKIHDGVEQHKHTEDGVEYTQEVANRDLAIVYGQTAWKFIKLYGPAVLVGVASVGCLVGSTLILRKRNIALAATVTALDTSFREYRGRLIERFGEDLDRELRFNIRAKEIEETVVDEDGNETVVKKVVHEVDPNAHSMYSVFFDDGNIGWSKNPELNKVFLIQQQEAANYRLKTEGFLPLNEVYKMIGAPLTSYGQIAGWVYSDDPDSGDNFVSFGLFDSDNEKARDFINLRERTILLDFNCIGNILPYM
jgi:hypothetical protein